MKAPTTGVVATDGVTVTAEDNSFAYETNRYFAPPFAVDRCPQLPIGVEEFSKAEKKGARRVRVKYPNMPEPLFGLLMFCKVPKAATGPGSRSYRIQIPDSYVQATDGGRISVVYEEVETPNKQVVNWVLWLSRVPLPAAGG
jgi:hypothetical protein